MTCKAASETQIKEGNISLFNLLLLLCCRGPGDRPLKNWGFDGDTFISLSLSLALSLALSLSLSLLGSHIRDVGKKGCSHMVREIVFVWSRVIDRCVFVLLLLDLSLTPSVIALDVFDSVTVSHQSKVKSLESLDSFCLSRSYILPSSL